MNGEFQSNYNPNYERPYMTFFNTLTKTKIWKPVTDISGSLYKKT